MDKFNVFLSSIDWLFLAVILIGGRYWGTKYFKVSKNPALNFLAFATAFAGVYLLLHQIAFGLKKDEIVNLFITYLFATSFYELLAKFLFQWIEKVAGINKQEAAQTMDDGEDETGIGGGTVGTPKPKP